MATGTEIKEKISDLPELQGSLRGFNVIGSKNNESGEPESFKCDLGFVEDAADAANDAAGTAQEKASLAQEKATEAQRAADEAAARASEAASATEGITVIEQSIQAAETGRQQAEARRDEAESSRGEAETERVEAESERETAETAREQAEANRASEEAERESAESAREAQAASDHIRAESDHSQADTDHNTASSDHSLAESDHSTASADHAQAESDHQQASSDHSQAETDHQTASSDHSTAGTDHAQAESDSAQAGADHTRAESDSARADTDHTRAEADHSTAQQDHTQAASDHSQAGSDHSQASSDHSTAQSDHTQASSDHSQAEQDHTASVGATNACNSARESIEANEATRQSNETERSSAESARSSAESSRQSAESSRESAEAARNTAEGQRASAETARAQQASSDHSTAQADHQTAESDHTNEQGRQTAEVARQSAETARAAAESARVAEEERRVQEYGEFEFDINEGLACIEGNGDLPDWEEDSEGGSTRAFATGEYCKHEWTDPVSGETKNYVFRFLSPVAIGDEWDEENVVQTSVFGELKEMVIGDQEALTIGVSSADGQMPVAGISVIVQNVTKGSTQTLTTDQNGLISLLLDKGDVVDITAAQQSGYQKPGTVRHKATMNRAYAYIVYQTQPDICTITAMLRTEHGNVIGVDDVIGLTLDDNTTILATVDSNGNAVFENVPYGHTGSIRVIKHAGFTTPAPQTVDTSHATISLDFIYVTSGVGILMVRADGSESPLEDWGEEDVLVAIHVNTEDLLDNNADYYIKAECLADTWFVSANNKQWATQNLNFPNVPADSATDYNGEGNTAAMLADAADLEISSPAATFAVAQSFTLGGHTAIGFIGTKRQMNPIFENKDLIYSMLTLGGFTPAYYNKNIWSSTQASATYAWYWSSGYWHNNSKGSRYAVVPFFAI